jgi:hypothetical protein
VPGKRKTWCQHFAGACRRGPRCSFSVGMYSMKYADIAQSLTIRGNAERKRKIRTPHRSAHYARDLTQHGATYAKPGRLN